jgi:putative nucleotidyltransferase with HDIG domain
MRRARLLAIIGRDGITMQTLDTANVVNAAGPSSGFMGWLSAILAKFLGTSKPDAGETSRPISYPCNEAESEGEFVLAAGGYRIRVPHPSDVGHSVGDMLPSVKEGLLLLPPLPMVIIQLLREIQDPKSTAASVAEVASSDPSLAASLLRTANSASMGLSRTITSVSEAVSYLGFGTVKAMVIRLRLDEVLAPKDPEAAIDAEDLWVHSLAVSYAAESLARRVGGVDAGFVATLGLLHDIGKLAVLAQLPQEAAKLRGVVSDGETSRLAREAQVLGLDHAGIGANLAAKWKLPADLVQAIRWHHRPAGAFSPADPLPLRKALHIVQIANQLVKYCYSHTDSMEIDAVSPEAFELLNLEPSLSKLLEKPIRDAVSKAIFFADGNSKRPAAAARRFLHPLTGDHAAQVAATPGQIEPRIGQDDATIARMFSFDDAIELSNNNGSRDSMVGVKHGRFSTSATASGIQKCVSAVRAHQDELGLSVETRMTAAMTVKSVLANLQSLCTPTELIEVAQMVDGARLTLAIRAAGLATARRINAPATPIMSRRLAEADLACLLNLGWFERVAVSGDGSAIVFVGR